jgi:hypothetical protein
VREQKQRHKQPNFIYTQDDGEEEESSSFSLSGCHFFVGQTNNCHRQFPSFFVHSKNDLSQMLKSQSFFELHKIVYSQMSSRRVNKIDKKPRDPRHRRRVSNGHGGESVRLPTTPTGKSKKKKENRNWKQRKCVRVTAVDFPFFPSIFHSYLKTYGM